MITSKEASSYIKKINDEHLIIKELFSKFRDTISSDSSLEDITNFLRTTIITHLDAEGDIILKIKELYPTYQSHLDHHEEMKQRFYKVYDGVLSSDKEKFVKLELLIEFNNYIMNIEYYDHELIDILKSIECQSKIKKLFKKYFLGGVWGN